MKFCWTTLYVKDMEESLRFYRDIVGLTLQRRTTPSPEMELAFLGVGDTQIELIRDTKVNGIKFSDNVSIGFRADSLAELGKILAERGIPVHSGPFQPNPTLKFLYVLDPDGMKVQFIEFLK